MKSRLAILSTALGIVLAVNGGAGYLSNTGKALGVIGKVHAAETQSEKIAVKKSIVTMVNAIDAKQWEVAVSQFDAYVFVDYSSLSGQPGSMTEAESLVDVLRKMNEFSVEIAAVVSGNGTYVGVAEASDIERRIANEVLKTKPS